MLEKNMLENKKCALRKRILFFSFFFFNICLNAQNFIRFSDLKSFDSVTILNNKKKYIINKLNFKNYKFSANDYVYYNNKSLDFSISNDTLFFFDRVKEIETISLVKDDLKDKNEKNVSSSKNKREMADFWCDKKVATLVKFNTKKKAFIKSFTLFPLMLDSSKGILEIQITSNNSGLPDSDSSILTFEKDLSEVTSKKWEIILPRIIKYPENGFFLIFYLKNGEKRNVALRLNSDSEMLMYNAESNDWKKIGFNGYYYKLKILQ